MGFYLHGKRKRAQFASEECGRRLCLEFVRCPFLSGRACVCLSVMWTRVVEESSVCECRVDESSVCETVPCGRGAERPEPNRDDGRKACEGRSRTRHSFNMKLQSGQGAMALLTYFVMPSSDCDAPVCLPVGQVRSNERARQRTRRDHKMFAGRYNAKKPLGCVRVR